VKRGYVYKCFQLYFLMDIKELLERKLKNKFMKDKETIAVLIFGSYARGEQYRDIDVCIVLNKKMDNLKMSKKRVGFMIGLPDIVDLQIFQQLPVYIRKRVLKDGKVIFCKDEDRLYEIAFETIKEFDSYEKLYNMYLEGIKNG